ncbi:MAG: tRNA threonylcarbamoyladenosine dehydratase [Leptospiraceae bacterium]|nr:tRNA threonylcarbamoyladenosine dehydratase [Leptospiraceae bacterium]
MLVRAGIGSLTIVDGDVIVLSNLNRQLHTLQTNVGKLKAESLAERLLQINPMLRLQIVSQYIDKKEGFENLLSQNLSVCIDAIDTLTNKCNLIQTCVERQVPIISSMGAGGKLNPNKVKVADISQTYNCRLAYYVRKKLKKVGIQKGVKVVFSTERPIKESITLDEKVKGKKSTIGTISYMPNIFGCFVASEALNLILKTY